ncbi:uncharacterized protein MONBRDRAFT_4843 [Monosiga brevicollis MX1]|uniref:Uncharacterized protein n=1 Tax=Monosiga brevicollis TaxID=81824 RepID=A9UP42_MONBE|nr:uncharacterized protein MONBRDRAFT_4843 [Monosiga brevicollis MX1]EDQ92807.1 predicted protein [Monosiga brevicollis MX1]|eukprot:XP_001742569.1 hypothetical protein [Monosiga brevicollis MX1]
MSRRLDMLALEALVHESDAAFKNASSGGVRIGASANTAGGSTPSPRSSSQRSSYIAIEPTGSPRVSSQRSSYMMGPDIGGLTRTRSATASPNQARASGVQKLPMPTHLFAHDSPAVERQPSFFDQMPPMVAHLPPEFERGRSLHRPPISEQLRASNSMGNLSSLTCMYLSRLLASRAQPPPLSPLLMFNPWFFHTLCRVVTTPSPTRSTRSTRSPGRPSLRTSGNIRPLSPRSNSPRGRNAQRITTFGVDGASTVTSTSPHSNSRVSSARASLTLSRGDSGSDIFSARPRLPLGSDWSYDGTARSPSVASDSTVDQAPRKRHSTSSLPGTASSRTHPRRAASTDLLSPAASTSKTLSSQGLLAAVALLADLSDDEGGETDSLDVFSGSEVREGEDRSSQVTKQSVLDFGRPPLAPTQPEPEQHGSAATPTSDTLGQHQADSIDTAQDDAPGIHRGDRTRTRTVSFSDDAWEDFDLLGENTAESDPTEVPTFAGEVASAEPEPSVELDDATPLQTAFSKASEIPPLPTIIEPELRHGPTTSLDPSSTDSQDYSKQRHSIELGKHLHRRDGNELLFAAIAAVRQHGDTQIAQPTTMLPTDPKMSPSAVFMTHWRGDNTILADAQPRPLICTWRLDLPCEPGSRLARYPCSTPECLSFVDEDLAAELASPHVLPGDTFLHR